MLVSTYREAAWALELYARQSPALRPGWHGVLYHHNQRVEGQKGQVRKTTFGTVKYYIHPEDAGISREHGEIDATDTDSDFLITGWNFANQKHIPALPDREDLAPVSFPKAIALLAAKDAWERQRQEATAMEAIMESIGAITESLLSQEEVSGNLADLAAAGYFVRSGDKYHPSEYLMDSWKFSTAAKSLTLQDQLVLAVGILDWRNAPNESSLEKSTDA